MKKGEVTMKVAVIIRHPYRDSDYRVDTYSVPDKFMDRPDYVKAYINGGLLGHFEVVAITTKYTNSDYEFKGTDADLEKYDKWLKNNEKQS